MLYSRKMLIVDTQTSPYSVDSLYGTGACLCSNGCTREGYYLLL
jgi:hypothetical protein